MAFKIAFQPSGASGEMHEGETLLDAARRAGVGLDSSCGGYGVCGKCKVQTLGGEFTPVSKEELDLLTPAEISGGGRLACLAMPVTDAEVFVPAGSVPVVQVVFGDVSSRPVLLSPVVKSCYVELPPPDIDGPAADSERLKEGLAGKYGLKELSVCYPALKGLSSILRDGNWKVTAAVRSDEEVVGVSDGYRPRLLGAAIDVGTTTLEGCLCDLNTGEALAAVVMANPQSYAGADVMSRISYATSRDGAAGELQGSIAGALNRMLAGMAASAGVSEGVDGITEVVVVGNTVMHHLLLGLPAGALGVYPFTPALSREMEFPAGDIGIKVSGCGRAVTLPVLGGFVGSDHVAVLISEEPYNQGLVTLIIDAGTNGEISVGNRDRLITASCATGPAFEGAGVRFGMRAGAGAIEAVIIDPDTKEAAYKVIGAPGWSTELKPSGARGICGSGIVDAVAQMYLAGVIDRTGAFVKGLDHPRVRYDGASGPEYVIAWGSETGAGVDISVSAEDVRAVQLAKAALSAGTKVLLNEYGVDKADKVVLAGAFGNRMDVQNAVVLGMLPPCRQEDVRLAGNAALGGARAALLSARKREEARLVADRAVYLEMSLHPAFQDEFIASLAMP